ncbi:MAG: hypothetical protein GY765_07665, partial [bacterium]|nr:hypothetical protein [bacterium]
LVRFYAVHTLAEFWELEALAPIIEMLKKNDDAVHDAQSALETYIYRTWDYRGVEPLIKALAGSPPGVQKTINRLLESIAFEKYPGGAVGITQWWQEWWLENKKDILQKQKDLQGIPRRGI